eukprot:357202-Chlamydomonas_euryale.AAC.8
MFQNEYTLPCSRMVSSTVSTPGCRAVCAISLWATQAAGAVSKLTADEKAFSRWIHAPLLEAAPVNDLALWDAQRTHSSPLSC